MLNRLAKHHNYWLKMLYNLGADDYLANELLQQMYLKLHDKENIAYGDDVNKYYVYKTLKSLYIQHFKDMNKTVNIEVLDYTDCEEIDYNIEKDDAEDLILDKIRKIAEGMTPYHQLLLQTYYGIRLNKNNLNVSTGRSMDKIATEMEASKGHVNYHLRKIRLELTNALNEDLEDYFNDDYSRITNS